MPILSKDGKIIINKGKVLTHFPEDAKLLTKVETILQNTNTNADEIEKIKNGEAPVGNIRSISVDGVKMKPDEEFNVEITLPEDKIGATKLSYNATTGKLFLLNSKEEVLDSVNLPLELVVKSGKYDAQTSNIILTLSTGEEIKIPVGELIDTYTADESTIHMDSNNQFSVHTKLIEIINSKLEKVSLDEYAKKADISDTYQRKLVSGGNIKTINGQTILGSGNINITGSGEINPEGTTYTYFVGSDSDCSWYRLAKVISPLNNASGTFVVDVYMDNKETDKRIFRGTSRFIISCGFDQTGEFISDVISLFQKPEESTKTQDGSSYEENKIVSIALEKSDDGVFVVGLLNRNIDESIWGNFWIEVSIKNNLNFEVIELKKVEYARDNSNIALTDIIASFDKDNLVFNIDMTYAKYYSLLSNLSANEYSITNGQTSTGIDLKIFAIANISGTEKNFRWTFCNNEVNGIDLTPVLLDETLTIGLDTFNIQGYINGHYVTPISAYAKISLTQIYGEISITASSGGTIKLYRNESVILTAENGETKTENITLKDGVNYKLVSTDNLCVATFRPLTNTGVNELETIVNFKIQNSFSDTDVPYSGDFSNTFPEGYIKSATYSYGIDAELRNYDLYNLNDVMVRKDNLKTINGTSLIGTGNLIITGSGTDNLDDYYKKTETNELLANKADKSELFSKDYNDLNNKPTIPTKTSQLTNDSRYLTEEVNPIVDIEFDENTRVLSVNHSDDTGGEIARDIALITDIEGLQLTTSIDPSTYVMTVALKDFEGNVIDSGTVDLPLETMVVSASYSSGTLTLTLKNGQTLNVDISSIISGLVPESRTINGKALTQNITLSKSDVGLGSVVNTGDSATPVSGGTTKFTTGGAYTELAKKQDKLVSGSNIKTFNGNSILGSGNLEISGTITLSNNWVEGSNSITLSEGLYLICVTYYDSELAFNQTAELGVIGVGSLPTNNTVNFKKVFANYYANSTLNVHYLRISEYNTGVFTLAAYKTVYNNTTSSTDIESGAKIYYKQIM